MNFDHLILTPFNLDFAKWKKQAYLDDEWMAHRMDIFKTVTYPSIAAQTCLNFTWIVVCDADTPSKWRSEINTYLPLAQVFYAKYNTKMWERLIQHCRSTKHILTTRFDNDDALHETFIEVVQANFNPLKLGYLNILNGLVTDGKKVFHVKRMSNPFTSQMSTSPTNHIRIMKHDHIRNQEGFVQLKDTEPLWLTYVHGMNVGNSLPDPDTKTGIYALRGFNINLPIMQKLNIK